MHRQIDPHWTGCLVNSFHSFTLSYKFIIFPKHCWIPEDTKSLEGSQALEQTQRHFYLFVVLYVPHNVILSKEKLKKTKHICLTDAFLPTYDVIPLHVVSKRKIYANWGHEKCILIECHDSHTQSEVMWWDPVRKRFVMISLCIYNAHRTVVLSGPIGTAVVMNHSRNVGWLK